nr:hypothetical protein [Nocardia grenadensis]
MGLQQATGPAQVLGRRVARIEDIEGATGAGLDEQHLAAPLRARRTGESGVGDHFAQTGQGCIDPEVVRVRRRTVEIQHGQLPGGAVGPRPAGIGGEAGGQLTGGAGDHGQVVLGRSAIDFGHRRIADLQLPAGVDVVGEPAREHGALIDALRRPGESAGPAHDPLTIHHRGQPDTVYLGREGPPVSQPGRGFQIQCRREFDLGARDRAVQYGGRFAGRHQRRRPPRA